MNYQELDLVILKHILSNKKHALEFANECDEKLFSTDAWRFARLVLEYIRVYKEIPTQKVMHERVRVTNNESLLAYITSVWTDIGKVNIDEREYKHDLEKIKNRFTERLIYNLKDHLVDANGQVDLKKSVTELNSAIQHIKSVSQLKAYEQKSLKESLTDFRNRYSAKLHNPALGVGLKTGYGFLDFVMGGLRKQELLLIGAETGAGKSLLMMNMGINMWLGDNTLDTTQDFSAGVDILYFSLEMPYADMLERVMAAVARVPQTSIRDAILTPDESLRLAKATKFIERYPHDFTIVDIPRGATMSAIELIFNDICATSKKPQVVIIDYLALLSAEQKEMSDWLQLNYLSEAFHEMLRAHDVAGITATQLNRPAAKSAGAATGASTTGLHRLSRSALQAANSNFVLLIESRANEKDRQDMPLHLVKSRRTPLVSGTIYKQLSFCALVNSGLESSTTAQTDDISDSLE